MTSDPGVGDPGAAGLPLDDPRLRAFLPLLYVAWADGDLTGEEIRAVCARASAVAGLDVDCRSALGRWLDPERPPSAADLQRLLGRTRRAAAAMTRAEKLSLAELGAEMARSGDRELQPAERRALEELEAALGVSGSEASRALLAPERPAPAPEEPAPAFDPAAMNRLLEPDHREVRRALRETLGGPGFEHVYGLDREAYRARVLEWCRVLAERGFGALSYPRECGGADDPGAFVAAFETLALHDLSLLVKFGVQFGLFGGSILQLGGAHHHRRYLPAVASLELPGCFAMTETGHGSNVGDIETVARYDPASGEIEIHTPVPAARKDYIGNAARDGRLATVFAQLRVGEEAHGVHAFLVPIRDERGHPQPGVRIEDCGDKLGLQGVDNGRLYFDRVRIPRENLLDRFGALSPEGEYTSPIASPSKRFFTMLGTLVGGRVSVALAALSATKSALAIAVRYGARRRQFGPAGAPEVPILDYLSHQRRLMPRLAATYASSFALQDLARRYVASPAEDRREIEALAAGLKAFTTRHATDTIQTCRECCGGQGYLAVNRFAALKADTDVFTTFEGDNTVLLQLVAKGLLSGYRRQFGEMSLLGLARHLAGAAVTALTELNPLVTRLTDESHLRDPDFQLGALRWREQHLLATLARRLKRKLEGGMDSFQALLECQDHMLETARASVEHHVLERFAAAAVGGDGPQREVLVLLRDLFALSRIEQDRGWFLEHGYLDPPKSKAVRKLVTRLCRETRSHALPLVEAFDIPAQCLGAPIAL